MICMLLAFPALGQARGIGMFVEPSTAYNWRLGVDVTGRDDDTYVLSGTYQFKLGNCARIIAAAGAGSFDPAGDAFDAAFTLGGTGWVLLNPCPNPIRPPNPRFFAYGGAGLTDLEGRIIYHTSLGFAVVYHYVRIAAVKVEPWITPRLRYAESIAENGDDDLELAIGAGLNFGLGATAGLRVAFDCCIDGKPLWSWGLSLWR